MATITSGAVEFMGRQIVLGQPVLVDGRKGIPFLAWVKTDPAHTTVRVKWDNTYMPSDFSDRYGRKATIVPLTELAAA